MPHASQQNTTPAHELPLEKRAALTSGADARHLNGPEREHLVYDHRWPAWSAQGRAEHINGYRAFHAGHMLPAGSGYGDSWNPGLVREVGVAIGEECVQEKVAVLLGPGVNIKRNPLGGRSFELFVEDPISPGMRP